MLEILASEHRATVQDILSWVICLAALYWGGGPERAVALVWLVVFEIIGGVYKRLPEMSFRLTEVDTFLASADVFAGIAFVAIALYANRNYPLWIAGMQVLAMTAHLARGLAEAISPVAYVTMVVAPGWFQLLFLAAGLIRHVLRKRKYGEYRDWRVPLSLPKWFAPST